MVLNYIKLFPPNKSISPNSWFPLTPPRNMTLDPNIPERFPERINWKPSGRRMARRRCTKWSLGLMLVAVNGFIYAQETYWMNMCVYIYIYIYIHDFLWANLKPISLKLLLWNFFSGNDSGFRWTILENSKHSKLPTSLKGSMYWGKELASPLKRDISLTLPYTVDILITCATIWIQ